MKYQKSKDIKARNALSDINWEDDDVMGEPPRKKNKKSNKPPADICKNIRLYSPKKKKNNFESVDRDVCYTYNSALSAIKREENPLGLNIK